jgi:protein-disulfide isomerase
MRIVLAFFLFQFCVLAKSNLNIALPQEVLHTKEELLAPNPKDIQFGNKKAKVQVVVFDSYSCFHCANLYNETLPVLETMYIKTGKILFIHKEFPLDKLALFASKVVHCSINPTKTMHEIYSKHNSFLVENYEQKLLAINGVNRVCVKKFDDKTITKLAYEYSKVLQINSTPTVYINGQPLEKKALKYFIAKIDSELEKK